MNKVFIPKDDQRIPDFFTITINYLSGRKQKLDVVKCQYYKEIDGYEILSKDNLMKIVPNGSIECIDYDSNFTKLMEIKGEQVEKE